MRTTTAIVLASAVAIGGAAVAQQDQSTRSDRSNKAVGAPASAKTGVKGVYSLKSTMGISTGSQPSGEAEAAADDEQGQSEQAGSVAPAD